MTDAAQGEPSLHEVFEKPFKVAPAFEWWRTPDNYRRYRGGQSLPETVKVWRVQKTSDKPGHASKPSGVVCRPEAFKGSPDAEALISGYNLGKQYEAVAVGRDGNFLQWGFSAPPSQMTDAGRNFFLNCVCYISKFKGKAPPARMGW